jgi:hypothetical protein
MTDDGEERAHLGFQRGVAKNGEGWRRCSLVVDGDGVSEAPGDEGGEDEERRDGAGSNPWSILPILSWRDAEGWLERCGVQGSFGSSCSR